MTETRKIREKSSSVSFADVAHQTLIFDSHTESERLILELADTPWVQRLRYVSQTGNTRLVYMFAEHSRFGHSLGAAYLATQLMRKLEKLHPDLVKPYKNAVAAAAILHDLGHVAPGSHLGEKVWSRRGDSHHETLSARVIREDAEIQNVLSRFGDTLTDDVCSILSGGESNLPPWTSAAITGGGWNADRGNWAIVDSTMCAVSYGRYNVTALIDAFRLSDDGKLVLQESRCDALTHFFVARDSMYRQVYQHRVLQAADALTQNIIVRLRDVLENTNTNADDVLEEQNIFCDPTMRLALRSSEYASELPLKALYHMTESWWYYHLEQWCDSKDKILSDLAKRLMQRNLLKTIRLEETADGLTENSQKIIVEAKETAIKQGFDPRYYICLIQDKDKHRSKAEKPPEVLLDNGSVVPATEVEPMIEQILARPSHDRSWLAVPETVKSALGIAR